MKHLLSILILLGFISVSTADIGDVYYCQSINVVTIKPDKVVEHASEQFTFKRELGELIFGDNEDDFFHKSSFAVTFMKGETFFAEALTGATIRYWDGRLYYNTNHPADEVTIAIQADCNTFE